MATGRRGYTMDQVLAAIHGSGGIVKIVQDRLGCSWKTARKYINKWATTREAFETEQEILLDAAEANVARVVFGGDLETSKWVLVNKGQSRGYGKRRVDVTSGGKPVILVWKGDGGDNGKR